MIDIKVWGDYACFTRPEFKVERVSYPVMTPSAARGVLEAIYWKPQMAYRVKRIGVLELGSQTSLLRNEISSRQSEKANPLVVEDQRQQRSSLILQGIDLSKPLCYRIQARIVLRDGETNLGKHLDCFRRRAEKGQYHLKPYLGCREFPADFAVMDEPGPEPEADLRLPPIGTMLFDTAYIEDEAWHADHEDDRMEFWRHSVDGAARIVKGYAKRLFFDADAFVHGGWLSVPQDKYEELDRLEARHGTA